MFVFNVSPIWGAVLIVVATVLVYVIARLTWGPLGEPGLPAAFAFALTLLGVFIFSISPLSVVTTSNPHEKPWNTFQSQVDKEELNKTIAETIGSDKVAISVDEKKNIIGEKKNIIGDMADGDIFEFTAIDEGLTQHGSFYFTEDSLEIVLQGEQTDVQEFSVSTK